MTKGEQRNHKRIRYCRKCGRELIDVTIPSVKTGKYNELTGEPVMTRERHTIECPTHGCGHDTNENDWGLIRHGPWRFGFFSLDGTCVRCGYKDSGCWGF